MEKVLPNWMRYKGMNKWLKELFDFCRDNSVDVVEHFKGLDEFDKERFLRGCFKNHNRIQVLKNQIDKLKTKHKEIIDNHKNGCDSLIQRNMELQNRIFYEEKVNRLLKERIKNFEELYSGGEVLENIL